MLFFNSAVAEPHPQPIGLVGDQAAASGQAVASLFCQQCLSPGGHTGETEAATGRRCVQLIPC
jgi:hypothetical protein